MPVIRNATEGASYFYSYMAKNETLGEIESGERDDDIVPVLKWNRFRSSWGLRDYSSGNLKTTLKGRGFNFWSFIVESTNGKETIVIWNTPVKFKDFVRLQESSGRFFLDNLQKSVNVQYYTSTLSVLIQTAPQLPKEVQNMIKAYLKEEAFFKPNNLLGLIKFNVGKIVNKYFGSIVPEYKTKIYELVNLVKNPRELINQGAIEEYAKFLDKKFNFEIAKKSTGIHSPLSKALKKQMEFSFTKLLKIGFNVTELLVAPEVFLEEKIIKKLVQQGLQGAIRFEQKLELFKGIKFLEGKSIIEIGTDVGLDLATNNISFNSLRKSGQNKLKNKSTLKIKDLSKQQFRIQ